MADATMSGSSVPRWPGEARAACAFTFDLDAETLWMARGVTEPVALSQGRFGPVEGVPRILELLESVQIRASFFIPAWTAAQDRKSTRLNSSHITNSYAVFCLTKKIVTPQSNHWIKTKKNKQLEHRHNMIY